LDFGFLFARVTSTGTASALDAGKGRLREAVEAVKGNRGAGALHVAAGRGRMAVCVYMVEELLTDVNASDDEGGFFCFFPCLVFLPLLEQEKNPHMVTSLDQRLVAAWLAM